MEHMELLGRKIKELSKILKNEQVGNLEIKEEVNIFLMRRLKISFKIFYNSSRTDYDKYIMYIELTYFSGSNRIDSFSEDEVGIRFGDEFEYLKRCLAEKTRERRKINGYLIAMESNVNEAKKKHEIYGSYIEAVHVRNFTAAYDTVEFYLRQIKKQITKIKKAYQENKNIENFLNNLKVLTGLANDEIGIYSFRFFSSGLKNYDWASGKVQDYLKNIEKYVEEIRKRYK